MRLPKLALDTARKIVNPSLILVVKDLLDAGLTEHEVCQWLHTPNTELDYHPPMELCLTGQGGQVRATIASAGGRGPEHPESLRAVEEVSEPGFEEPEE